MSLACSKQLRTRSRTTGSPNGEQRFVTLGLLVGIPVSVVHTESEREIRVISFRKATKREAQLYFDAIQN